MHTPAQVIAHLRRHRLLLTTAESCTAGMVISLLADIEGSGSSMDCGYVVYSPDAKKRLLGVRPETIERFNLTSEEVAREMVIGALRDSPATVAIANTGVAGPEPMDGIEPGTVCLAWAFHYAKREIVFADTVRFDGDRNAVRRAAALESIGRIIPYHQQILAGRYLQA